jgi:hypothetical protein
MHRPRERVVDLFRRQPRILRCARSEVELRRVRSRSILLSHIICLRVTWDAVQFWSLFRGVVIERKHEQTIPKR